MTEKCICIFKARRNRIVRQKNITLQRERFNFVSDFIGEIERLGNVGFGLLLAGALLYTLGALVYARRRPDPRPAIFGYHEVFHLLVVAAAAAHYAAVAGFVLPRL